MNKKNLIIYTVGLVLLLGICFWGYYTTTLDYNLSNSKVIFNNILDIKKIAENQIAVFYKYPFQNDKYGLGVSVFQKNNRGWSTKLDTAQSSSDTELTMNFIHVGNEKNIVYGYINDASIDKIKIVYDDASEFADIVDTNWKKLWMHELNYKDFKLELYDKNNQLLYIEGSLGANTK